MGRPPFAASEAAPLYGERRELVWMMRFAHPDPKFVLTIDANRLHLFQYWRHSWRTLYLSKAVFTEPESGKS